jgi:hypothetical protein
MDHRSAKKQLGVVMALSLLGVLMAGVLQAQPRGPKAPGPNNQPRAPQPVPHYSPPAGGPVLTTWYCFKCKKEVGRGTSRPSVTRCPHCGTFSKSNGQSISGELLAVFGIGLLLLAAFAIKTMGWLNFGPGYAE